MIKRFMLLISVVAVLCGPAPAAQRVDCWWEEPTLLAEFDAGGKPADDTRNNELDYADKRAGDCSLVYTASKRSTPSAIGFTTGAYQQSWKLGSNWSLKLWLKCRGADAGGKWTVVLQDAAGKNATGPLGGFAADNQWHQLAVAIKDLTAEPGFDFSAVASSRFPATLPAGSKVWFDDVHWSDGQNEIGVTDKSIDQRMAEARASLAQRRQEAFGSGGEKDEPGADKRLLCQLLAGQDIAGSNKELRAFYREELELCRQKMANLWTLSMNTRLFITYYRLGSKSDLKRLEPETEKLLLELLWERTKEKNDIAISRWSTWWIVGSENHDINSKASNLISSRIFMNAPEYASRVYPDLGHGDGHGYWFHDKAGNQRGLGPEGRANLKDGKQYTAKDHYQAWLRYLKEYFAERAKKGFFLERAAPGYFNWTMGFIQSVHDYCGDDDLKEQTRQFLDLVWADWAQEQIAGLCGGPKTRHAGVGGFDSSSNLAEFYVGGSMSAGNVTFTQLLSDYAWPRVVWELALDRQSLGCYACQSRGIGEEERTRPRPQGTERSMLGNCESRIVKYSWVTPDYILGTQMDHPDAVFNHLATSKRWEGLVVAGSRWQRVCLMGPLEEGAKPGSYAHEGLVYQAVQDRQVLITQQSPCWTGISPDWFPSPAPKMVGQSAEVYIGKQWEKIEEKGGWVFLHWANVYVAVRVLEAEKETLKGRANLVDKRDSADPDCVAISQRAFEWDEAHVSMKLLNDYSPVIIEAGRRADFATLADFEKAILANPLKLRKIAVPGHCIVEYRGCGPDAKQLVYNAGSPGIPTIGGAYMNYSPKKVFDSPFIQSEYNSGIAVIRKGDQQLRMDFNRALKQ